MHYKVIKGMIDTPKLVGHDMVNVPTTLPNDFLQTLRMLGPVFLVQQPLVHSTSLHSHLALPGFVPYMR